MSEGMTAPTRLSAALTAIRWGPRALAEATGYSERTIYRWLCGQNEAPEELVRWAEITAETLEMYPPPQNKRAIVLYNGSET